MEREFFDWDNWDELDVTALQFYNCVMKKDVGPIKSGDKINCIAVDFQHGYMIFYNEDGTKELHKESISIKLNGLMS